MRFTLLAIILSVSASPSLGRGGSVIAAGGTWAAVLRGDRCDAESRIIVNGPNGKSEGTAGFGFAIDGAAWGQFHARLSRVPRPGTSVIVFAGAQSFILNARGSDAWSRDSRQDQALLDVVRSADGLRIEARDSNGRRFSDRYDLAFAPTAIDAAAARCASLKLAKSANQQ